jgi:hypothetical protein
MEKVKTLRHTVSAAGGSIKLNDTISLAACNRCSMLSTLGMASSAAGDANRPAEALRAE